MPSYYADEIDAYHLIRCPLADLPACVREHPTAVVELWEPLPEPGLIGLLFGLAFVAWLGRK